MAVENLKSLPLRDLVELAKRRGVRGWHDMRKDQLVRVLAKTKPTRATKSAPAAKSLPNAKASRSGKSVPTNGVSRNGVSRNGTAAHAQSPIAVRSKGAAPSKLQSKPTAHKPAAHKQPTAAKPSTQKPAVKQPAARAPERKLVAAKLPTAAKAAASSKPVAAAVRVVAEPKRKPRPKSPVVVRRLTEAKAAQNRFKNLAFRTPPGQPDGYKKDRLIVMVRDAYWLHAYWELSRHGVVRAEAALGQDWHTARPVLRLLDVSSGATTSTAERVLRHIDVHGGVNNWYVDVQDPPRSYRLDIGYLTANGRFFMLARSNVVTTPQAAATDAIDENWSDVAENFDRIYAMSGGYAIDGSANELQELFEERLRRPMGKPMLARMGAGVVAGAQRKREFVFELDAELIVYGRSEPSAHVMLQGEPVTLRPDGTFTVRYSLPNCRQVIPAVASSADGVEQRTIVLAVERNTKVMEPVTRDSAE
jgi:hypothetical protein